MKEIEFAGSCRNGDGEVMDYIQIWKSMLQTEKANQNGLRLARKARKLFLKKEEPKRMEKRALRDFLKRRLVNNRKDKFTVDQLTESQMDTSSSQSIDPSPLVELLDQGHLTCPVCLEVVVRPLLLECGHSICLQCYEECSNFSLRCSTCRTDMTSPIQLPYKVLEELTKLRMSPISPEGQQFWCRQDQFEEWQALRRVNPWTLIPGDRLDFCTIKGWHPASFRQLFTNSKGELMIKITMKVNADLLVEIELLAYSRKLAPYGFFTKSLFKQYRTINRTQKFMTLAHSTRLDLEDPLPTFLPPLFTVPSEICFPGHLQQSASLEQQSSLLEQPEWPLKLFQHEMEQVGSDLLW